MRMNKRSPFHSLTPQLPAPASIGRPSRSRENSTRVFHIANRDRLQYLSYLLLSPRMHRQKSGLEEEP